MRDTRKIEKITEEKLKEQLGEITGQERFSLYTSARKSLVEQILAEIKGKMPKYTDHGSQHIAHVLDNAGKLLGIEENQNVLTGMDLYCLILSILFHDCGNIYGRKNHQLKIGRIYDLVRSATENNRRERLIISKITAAHTSEGVEDTLESLRKEPIEQLEGYPIQILKIAAILRFADELAEGPKRTSSFMQKEDLYSKNSSIYHRYAAVTDVFIDRGNERIALTYDIDIKASKQLSNRGEKSLSDLLNYIYHRIKKLNQERKYARYYCDLLTPFKKITVTFNFEINGELVSLNFPENFALTDLVVPGEKDKLLPDYNSKFEPVSIISQISNLI